MDKPGRFTYSQVEFPFKSLLQNILDTDNLENIHKKFKGELKNFDIVTFETDQDLPIHKLYYSSDKLYLLLDLYKKFVRKIFDDYFKGEDYIVYQAKPTFRCHIPGNLAVGSWHRDRDFGHPKGEINFYLPFTRTREENTIWAESDDGLEDFAPILTQLGECSWNFLNKCKHGNKINTSDETRLSIDFRIIPGSVYSENTTIETITTRTKLQVGHYFEKMVR